VRQICDLLENDMAPATATFSDEMDRLVTLWRKVSGKGSSKKQQAAQPRAS
jgi:hypothetical protein